MLLSLQSKLRSDTLPVVLLTNCNRTSKPSTQNSGERRKPTIRFVQKPGLRSPYCQGKYQVHKPAPEQPTRCWHADIYSSQPASQLTLSAPFEAMATACSACCLACFCCLLSLAAFLAAGVSTALVGHWTAEELPTAPKTQNLAVLCTSTGAALINVTWPGAATRSKGQKQSSPAPACSLKNGDHGVHINSAAQHSGNCLRSTPGKNVKRGIGHHPHATYRTHRPPSLLEIQPEELCKKLETTLVVPGVHVWLATAQALTVPFEVSRPTSAVLRGSDPAAVFPFVVWTFFYNVRKYKKRYNFNI